MVGTGLPSLRFSDNNLVLYQQVFYLEGFTVFCCLELFWEGTKTSFHLGTETEPHLEGGRVKAVKRPPSLSLPAGRGKWKIGCPVSLNAREQILVGKKPLRSPSRQCAICLCPKFYTLSPPLPALSHL